MTTTPRIGTGFQDPALESQAVFRAALDALAHPGTLLELPPAGEPPAGVQPAAALLLLSLLDPETRLWTSASIRATGADHWLRFHTGCELVETPAEAQFAWTSVPDDPLALTQLDAGNDLYPDSSCTCVIDVPALGPQAVGTVPWTLTGPGIRDSRRLQVAGPDTRFMASWQANRQVFPRGVDVFLAAGLTLCGLPRTTAIAVATSDSNAQRASDKEALCTSR